MSLGRRIELGYCSLCEYCCCSRKLVMFTLILLPVCELVTFHIICCKCVRTTTCARGCYNFPYYEHISLGLVDKLVFILLTLIVLCDIICTICDMQQCYANSLKLLSSTNYADFAAISFMDAYLLVPNFGIFVCTFCECMLTPML